MTSLLSLVVSFAFCLALAQAFVPPTTNDATTGTALGMASPNTFGGLLEFDHVPTQYATVSKHPFPPRGGAEGTTKSILKKNQAIDTSGKGINPTMLFSFQSIYMDPPQRSPYSVTPEQHGAALGWSGKDISTKSHPVGY